LRPPTRSGAPLKVWKNLPPTLRDVLDVARGHGDRTFLVYEDERVSFEAFYRAASAFARTLREAGVEPGDRVAIAMRNLPEWVACFYGALAVGAIATPLNAWWTGQELDYGIRHSGARVLVLDEPRYDRLADQLAGFPDLALVFVTRLGVAVDDPRVRDLHAVLGPPQSWAELPDLPPPDVALTPDDPATLFYTSGTTGRPKGVLASHRAVNSNIFTAAAAQARAFLRRGEAPPTPDPKGPQRAALLSVPFFHVTGCMASLNPALITGSKLVLMRKWDPIRAFELIQAERITQAGGVPTIAWQLLEHPARKDYDLSSLDAVLYGGAPAAPELARRLKATFPQFTLAQGWGMTETSGGAVYNVGEDYLHRPESCGVAGLVTELQIRNPDNPDAVLPLGASGELWCKGPMNAIGYWNDREATAATFVEGWVRTGDLARLDAEGFCTIVDRAKDMVIRGGENIHCLEVENALFEHPAVMDAAVVGVPHRTLGEEPAAVVTLKPGATVSEAELKAHVAQRLAAFKTPVAVRFWPEPLPRNANGKILKTELRRLFAPDAPRA
jgi:long-chain acyl-CoA synthetase